MRNTAKLSRKNENFVVRLLPENAHSAGTESRIFITAVLCVEISKSFRDGTYWKYMFYTQISTSFSLVGVTSNSTQIWFITCEISKELQISSNQITDLSLGVNLSDFVPAESKGHIFWPYR